MKCSYVGCKNEAKFKQVTKSHSRTQTTYLCEAHHHGNTGTKKGQIGGISFTTTVSNL